LFLHKYLKIIDICRIKTCFSIFCSILKWSFCAQSYNFKLGLSFNFGNEVKRIGLQLDANYQVDFFKEIL